MNALLLSSLVALAAPQAKEAPANPGNTPQAASLDGNWTIITMEKNGQAVDKANNMTVTVKDNVVTFSDRAGGEPSKDIRALRLSFGPNSTIQVTEAGADGKFSDQPGQRTPGTPGTPGSPGSAQGSKSGVYILTNSHFAICIHDDSARNPGDAPRPNDPNNPGARNNPQAGQAGQGQAGQAGRGAAGMPNSKNYVTVFLKREGASTPPR
jgi:hypothetical protein